MTPRQAALLRTRIEARWPEAEEVHVTADSEGARVQMMIDGTLFRFSVVDGGQLMRLLLTGSVLPGAVADGR